MKRFNSLFTVVMLAMSMVVVSSAITSCSKDDENPPANSNNNDDNTANSIVGTWTGSDMGAQISLTFKADGTGIAVEQFGGNSDVRKFSYVMINKSSGVITIVEEDKGEYYTEKCNFTIEGKKMFTDYGHLDLALQKE